MPLMVVKRALPASSRFTPEAAPMGRSGAFSRAGARVFSAHCFSEGDGSRPSNTSAMGDSATALLRLGVSAIRRTYHDRRCALGGEERVHHRDTETQRKQVSQDAAANAFCKYRGIEVDKEPDLLTRESEVCEQLGFMNAFDVLYAFELNDYCVSDEQINSVAAIQLDVLVCDRQVHLPTKTNSSQVQLMTKTLFVC